jgi:LPXTG-motif cell wall-anchored protein
MYLLTPQLAAGLYLFSTHITRTKIIVIVVVGVVVIAAVGFWLVRRRKVRA